MNQSNDVQTSKLVKVKRFVFHHEMYLYDIILLINFSCWRDLVYMLTKCH